MSARILIVEDERIAAEDLRDILSNLGYDVTAVGLERRRRHRASRSRGA